MSEDRVYGGIIDAILEGRDGVYLCDHKTATRVDPSYWMELETNPQLSLYFIAAMQNGLEPTFVWDVIQKPGISPKQLTKADIKEIHDEGTYQGQPTDEAPEYGDKETPKLYGLRVLVQYTETPEKYFHRRKVVRTRDEVLGFAKYLDTVTGEMKAAEKGELPIYENFHACKRYGSMCDYHKICSGRVDPTDASEFKKRETSAGDRKLAQGAISNSQMGTFLSCRQEWKFRYLDRIEPANREYKESLEFGLLVHGAIEEVLGQKWGSSKVTFPNG